MAKDSISEMVQKAQALLQQKLHPEARALFLRALEDRPDLPEAHYGLATICYHQGDVPGAAYHFKEVTRHDPLRAGAFINLGALYSHLGREADAIAALRRGLQIDPRRAEGYYDLGLVYRRTGHIDEAIAAYSEAVRLQPGMAEAHFNLANILLECDRFEESIEQYREALKGRPNWPEAIQGLKIAEGELHGTPPGVTETVVDSMHDSSDRMTPAGPDLNRLVDLKTHGALMAEIHRIAVEADGFNKSLAGEISHRLDAAIKGLSHCLLKPGVPSHELAMHLSAFEQAAQRFKAMHASLERIHSQMAHAGAELKKK